MSGRFEVGEYHGFIFIYGRYQHSKNEIEQTIRSYTGNELVKKVELKIMKVVEKHFVNNEFDEKGVPPSSEGYIFCDEKGNLWKNQYPKASYGQISDSGDWEVTPLIKEGSSLSDWMKKGSPFFGFDISHVYGELTYAKDTNSLTVYGVEYLREIESIINNFGLIVVDDPYLDGNNNICCVFKKILIPDPLKFQI